ncbi:related to glycerophosphoryl diester phosphodiesterase family protein [Cephalotrichum gorgonifer]|uniref:glycerophosphodiester phosphodiesterase n=1 Tax=Cephalotrichum gorgonifer TaxID=2041049 RepID=A0AAE8N7B2_9PEZI|nr:related to glycerophosphoryl diester phosphodiesterase family protein [Cephalotrichum gorgonifer]
MRLELVLALASLAAASPYGKPGKPGKPGHGKPCKPGHGKPGSCPPTQKVDTIQLGPRPYFLIDDMDEGPLKDKLESCKAIKDFKSTPWSIGHRGGGTLMMPEHSLESNMAGARMGAGVLECDVAFTSDRELVCRHSQCDLHFTTNILSIPELAAKCTQPFKPAADGKPASAKCCTSDITLEEFKSLCARMEGSNTAATKPEDFAKNVTPWRSELYATCGTVLSHKEHIELVKSLGLKFVPELKTPEVPMPFEGDYTQEMYAQQLVDEYIEAGVNPSDVTLQSFLYDDILYWLKKAPKFNSIFLDSTGETPETMPEAIALLDQRAKDGLKLLAPPIQYLVADNNGTIVASEYAKKAKELGFGIVAWSAERSGPISAASTYYYSTVKDIMNNDGDYFNLFHVLAQEVGIIGLFSDWSAPVTYYANCFGLF